MWKPSTIHFEFHNAHPECSIYATSVVNTRYWVYVIIDLSRSLHTFTIKEVI